MVSVSTYDDNCLEGEMKDRRVEYERQNQNISKNTAMELSSRPCGSGGNSYLSSRMGRAWKECV
jgi:hypothetical protein